MKKTALCLSVVLFDAAVTTRAWGRPGGVDPAPMFGINPANTNISPYVGVLSNPFVRWQITHDILAIDSPAIVLDRRGVLYSQSLLPRSAATGLPAGVNIISVRDSTPAISDSGNIYQWVAGRMRGYSSSGQLQWMGPPTNFTDGNGVKISPDGTVYAGGGDNLLYAFTPGGHLRWTAPGYLGSNSPPAIDASGNVYFASGVGLHGEYRSYDPNGNLRWSVPWNETWNASPLILGPDGNIYASENFGTSVYVHDPATGAVIRHQSNIFGGVQAIGPDGTLYSCSYQTVTAIDAFGTTLWETHIDPSMFFEDLTVDADGKVYCTTEEDQVLAFSATGEELWMVQLPLSNGQTLPPVVGADGTVFVQNGTYLTAIGGVVPAPGAAGLLMFAAGMLEYRRRR